jgi:hypothetical protein
LNQCSLELAPVEDDQGLPLGHRLDEIATLLEVDCNGRADQHAGGLPNPDRGRDGRREDEPAMRPKRPERAARGRPPCANRSSECPAAAPAD